MDEVLELNPSPNDAVYMQLRHAKQGTLVYVRCAFGHIRSRSVRSVTFGAQSVTFGTHSVTFGAHSVTFGHSQCAFSHIWSHLVTFGNMRIRSPKVDRASLAGRELCPTEFWQQI
eukprot:3247774-Pyramimonas_sp.AAC.2